MGQRQTPRPKDKKDTKDKQMTPQRTNKGETRKRHSYEFTDWAMI